MIEIAATIFVACFCFQVAVAVIGGIWMAVADGSRRHHPSGPQPESPMTRREWLELAAGLALLAALLLVFA